MKMNMKLKHYLHNLLMCLLDSGINLCGLYIFMYVLVEFYYYFQLKTIKIIPNVKYSLSLIHNMTYAILPKICLFLIYINSMCS